MSTYTTTFKYRRALEMGPLYLEGVIIGYLNKNKPITKSQTTEYSTDYVLTDHHILQSEAGGAGR
jgi:hypothetical protein